MTQALHREKSEVACASCQLKSKDNIQESRERIKGRFVRIPLGRDRRLFLGGGVLLSWFLFRTISGDGGDGLADCRSDLGDFFFDVLRGAPYPACEVFDGQAFVAFGLWGFSRRKPASDHEKQGGERKEQFRHTVSIHTKTIAYTYGGTVIGHDALDGVFRSDRV